MLTWNKPIYQTNETLDEGTILWECCRYTGNQYLKTTIKMMIIHYATYFPRSFLFAFLLTYIPYPYCYLINKTYVYTCGILKVL